MKMAILDLMALRQSLGLTQREAALLLEVAVNTWARWERGELGVHPERARQVRRLQQLVERYGESPLWGLGVAGLRDVLDGMTVPEALEARGLDKYGAPKHAWSSYWVNYTRLSTLARRVAAPGAGHAGGV